MAPKNQTIFKQLTVCHLILKKLLFKVNVFQCYSGYMSYKIVINIFRSLTQKYWTNHLSPYLFREYGATAKKIIRMDNSVNTLCYMEWTKSIGYNDKVPVEHNPTGTLI